MLSFTVSVVVGNRYFFRAFTENFVYMEGCIRFELVNAEKWKFHSKKLLSYNVIKSNNQINSSTKNDNSFLSAKMEK